MTGSSISFENSSGQTSGNTVSFVLSDTYNSDGSETTLKNKKKKQRNWQAWHLECFWQIGTALNYLQQRNMTHGNLRASNILIFNDNPQSSSPVIKLSDPGNTVVQIYFSASQEKSVSQKKISADHVEYLSMIS